MGVTKGSSFACSNCGSNKISVLETRFNSKGNHVLRRRYCTKCSHRFNTLEIPLEDLEKREASILQAAESIIAAARELSDVSLLSHHCVRKRAIDHENTFVDCCSSRLKDDRM